MPSFIEHIIDSITHPIIPPGWSRDGEGFRSGRATKNFYNNKGTFGVFTGLLRYERDDFAARMKAEPDIWSWLISGLKVLNWVFGRFFMIIFHALHDGIPLVINALKLAALIVASPYLIPKQGLKPVLEKMGALVDVMVSIPTKIVLDVLSHIAFITAKPVVMLVAVIKEWRAQRAASNDDARHETTDDLYRPTRRTQPEQGGGYRLGVAADYQPRQNVATESDQQPDLDNNHTVTGAAASPR